ncbi:hypothetical protein KJ359_004237 [Pestalotiopsis sp. 9143b]|nr:hypothetical protein KJ359_004237 [Pestalotiopsis sp. 9143b]
MPFQPKQLTQYQAEHLSELQGDVSETMMEYILALTPPFTEGNIIHDNACGSGAVLSTILTNDHPSNLHIEATDVNPQFVKGCAELAEKNNWPVTASLQSAQDITFLDNYFDYSFTNFAFHCLGDHDAAARQVYRTLKPGGVAVASIWVYMPHVDALQHAHWRTRGQDGSMPALLPLEGFVQEDLRKALAAGGFEEENIEFSEKTCFLKVSNLERFAQLSWSYLGPLPTGWSQNDEDKWDGATPDIVQLLQRGDGITKNEKGETLLKMVACIALAKK